jgi:hypothetical protein
VLAGQGDDKPSLELANRTRATQRGAV